MEPRTANLSITIKCADDSRMFSGQGRPLLAALVIKHLLEVVLQDLEMIDKFDAEDLTSRRDPSLSDSTTQHVAERQHTTTRRRATAEQTSLGDRCNSKSTSQKPCKYLHLAYNSKSSNLVIVVTVNLFNKLDLL